MSYTPTQDDINLLYQRHKKLYSKVNLLNSDFRTIDSLEGVLTNGTLTISANSDTRRTFTCNMHLAKTSAVAAYNVYDWANKYLRVFIGIEDVRTKIVHWYEVGLFIPTQNGFQYDTSNNTLSLSCVDLTGKLDDTTCGQVTGLGTIIKTGRYIRQSMIEVLKLGGITKYLIDYPQNDTEAENDKTKVPYDLEFGTGATVWNMLTTLRDLYYPYEMFFDGDTFVCKEIPSCKDDPVILNHEVIDPLIISENTTVDETTIRNCTEVWGSSIDSDYYTENVSYADGCYTLTYDSALTNFKVKSNKRFSFVAPETNAKGCSVKIVQGENTFGPYKIYSGTDKDGNDVELDAGVMVAKKYYVIKCYKDADKNLRMQYLGQGQVHAMVILSDNPPTGDAYEQAKIDEACDVLEYISTNDPSDTTGMYHSPYSIEKIGRRNSVLSGGDFENIPNDDLGLQRAEYENWKSCRLTDVKTLEMIMIPWLDVNKKISYTPRSGKPGEKHSPMEYITKEITINLGSGTMSVNMQKFYPYYPYITKKGE